MAWQVLWPALRVVIALRGGRFGLSPPARGDPYHRWWKTSLYRGARRVLATGRGGVVVSLVIASAFLLPLAGLLVALWGPTRWEPWALLAVALPLTLAFVGCAVGYLALRALPAEEWADALLAGAPADVVVRTLAYELRTACQWFLQATEPPAEFLREVLLAHAGPDHVELVEAKVAEEHDRLVAALDRCRAGVLRHREPLRRLVVLEARAAERLDLPVHELRESLLRVDPRRFRERAERFLDAYQTVLEGRSAAGAPAILAPRLAELTTTCRDLLSSTEAARDHLDQLFALDDKTLQQVQHLAHQHSASGALLRHARALGQVPAFARPQLRRYEGTAHHQGYQRLVQRLRFLVREQRSHPGFDLALGLARLCRSAADAAPRLGLDRAVVEHQGQLMEALATEGARRALGAASPDIATRRALVEQALLALEGLPTTVEAVLAWSSARVARSLDAVLAAMPDDPTARLVVVTHGYSRLVRDALLPARTRPGVSFLVLAADDGDDARRMRDELLEGAPAGTSCGLLEDERALGRLYDRGDRVLVVLGAEAFDDDRRVLHRRGVGRRLKRLVKPFDHAAVVVLAHGYKHHRHLGRVHERFEPHLGELEVLPGGRVDLLLTEDGSLRRGRRHRDLGHGGRDREDGDGDTARENGHGHGNGTGRGQRRDLDRGHGRRLVGDRKAERAHRR